MEKDSIVRRFTSTKFIISVIVLLSLVIIAIAQPTALSTELVVGLLGVIATYSGSNAFLTSFAMKQPVTIAENSPAITAPVADNSQVDHSAEILDLQTRLAQNEKTTAEIIEIIKQLMQRKNN